MEITISIPSQVPQGGMGNWVEDNPDSKVSDHGSRGTRILGLWGLR